MKFVFLVTWETKMENSPVAHSESTSVMRRRERWEVDDVSNVNDAKLTLQAALRDDVPWWSDGTYYIQLVGDFTRTI